MYKTWSNCTGATVLVLDENDLIQKSTCLHFKLKNFLDFYEKNPCKKDDSQKLF